jgi:leucyl-tRNA synthetase
VTEQKLWRSLKSKALDYKFKHQYLIGNYIVNFVCLSEKLVVVINEETLDFQEVANVERAKVIIEKGFKIIRFNKEEILRNIDGVLDAITQELDESEASSVIKKLKFLPLVLTPYSVTFMTLRTRENYYSRTESSC